MVRFPRWSGFCILLRRCLRKRSTLAQRVLQVDWNAVLPKQIGERFIRQLLNGRHAIAPQLLQLVEGVIVEGDQFAHERAALLRRNECRFNGGRRKSFRCGTCRTRSR